MGCHYLLQDILPTQELNPGLLHCRQILYHLTQQGSLTISHSLLKFMSLESVMLSNHLILCYPLLFLPSIFPSIRVFSSESSLPMRWYWSFSFSISLSNEYLGLIGFYLLVVQGSLKNLLQHYCSKASYFYPHLLWQK